MERLQLNSIYNLEAGSGFVLGLGPSLANHIKLLDDCYPSQIVSCNNMDEMSSIKYKYWVLAQPADDSNPLCVRRIYNRVNKMGATFIYTDCLDKTNYNEVNQLLIGKWIGYDQRHFKGEPCGWGHLEGGRSYCCDRIDKNRKTIQECFCEYTKTNTLYGAGDTVGVHMVAIAVMLGYNPIYVTGIDLDYTNGYFNNNADLTGDTIQRRIKMGVSSINKSAKMVDRIIDDFSIINKASENIGTKIYCIDIGLRINDVFEYKKID